MCRLLKNQENNMSYHQVLALSHHEGAPAGVRVLLPEDEQLKEIPAYDILALLTQIPAEGGNQEPQRLVINSVAQMDGHLLPLNTIMSLVEQFYFHDEAALPTSRERLQRSLGFAVEISPNVAEVVPFLAQGALLGLIPADPEDVSGKFMQSSPEIRALATHEGLGAAVLRMIIRDEDPWQGVVRESRRYYDLWTVTTRLRETGLISIVAGKYLITNKARQILTAIGTIPRGQIDEHMLAELDLACHSLY
jgi:hypothetical protein